MKGDNWCDLPIRSVNRLIPNMRFLMVTKLIFIFYIFNVSVCKLCRWSSRMFVFVGYELWGIVQEMEYDWLHMRSVSDMATCSTADW
jgi:hypothetical protein